MKVHAFLSRCLRMLSFLIIGIVFVLNFLFISGVSPNANETVTIELHANKSVLFLLIIAATLFALSFLKHYLEKVKELHLFFGTSALYIIMGIYLICNVDNTLRADALSVYQAAENILSGSVTPFLRGGYIYQYPHQIGLMLYDAVLCTYFRSTSACFAANLGFVIGINYLVYKITDLLFGDRFVNILSIILSFAFLPQFFFILFAYGNIPGLFFIMFAFYHTLRFCKNHRTADLVLMAAGACAAVTLRKNYLIGVVAIVIYVCLELFRKATVKRVIAMAAVVIGLLLPLKVLPQIFVDSASGMPSVLWLAMGTDIDNNACGPGWFDGTNIQIFFESGYDSEIAHMRGVEKVRQNIQKITNDPQSARDFFVRKTVSQWCDPLYQSIWTGPLADLDQHTHTRLLTSLYTGNGAEKVLSNAMKIYMLGFFGLGMLFIALYHKRCSGWELFYLTLIGGFLFHTVWEAKSQYIYPYFFPLIPFVAFSVSNILTEIKSRNPLKTFIKKAK